MPNKESIIRSLVGALPTSVNKQVDEKSKEVSYE